MYLGKGYKGILWSIIGDHDFFLAMFCSFLTGLHTTRWECDAENFEGANPWKRYKEISLEKLNLGVYSHQEQLDDPWSDHAIFRLPRVSPCMVRGDPLHILFCKGLYSHLIGGILHYVCYLDGPGKRQSKKPWERLSLLFSELQVVHSNPKIWRMRPKFHLLSHLFEEGARASQRNPNENAIWMDEDWVRRVARIIRRTHKDTSCLTVIQRYLLFLCQNLKTLKES